MTDAQNDLLRAPHGALSSVVLDEVAPSNEPDRDALVAGAAEIHAEAIQLTQFVRLRENEASSRRKRRRDRSDF